MGMNFKNTLCTMPPWNSNEVGDFKFIVWRENEWGKARSQKGASIFTGELTPQQFYQNYLPISASFGVKRGSSYALHFFLSKLISTRQFGKVWISFSLWVFFYIIDFYQSANFLSTLS